MNPSYSSIPPLLINTSNRVLGDYAASIEGLEVALITTLDGFDIASFSRGSDFRINRLAPMSSSLMAMGRAVAREIQANSCNRLIFEAEGNVVLFQSIGGGFPCILCMVLKRGGVLGRLLWAAGEIAKVLVEDSSLATSSKS